MSPFRSIVAFRYHFISFHDPSWPSSLREVIDSALQINEPSGDNYFSKLKHLHGRRSVSPYPTVGNVGDARSWHFGIRGPHGMTNCSPLCFIILVWKDW